MKLLTTKHAVITLGLGLSALLCNSAHALATTDTLTGWSATGDVATNGSTISLTTSYRDGLPSDDEPLNVSGHSAVDIALVESAAGVAAFSLDLPGAALNADLAGTEGSAIGQSFAVAAGQTLSFSWTFATQDLDYLDRAFVVIDGSIVTLATTATPGLATQTFSHLFSSAHLAKLALGVIDTGDTFGVSSLTIGSLKLATAVVAVPEPSSWALLAGGLGLVGFAAKRKRAGSF